MHVGHQLAVPTPHATDLYLPAVERRRCATALIAGFAGLGLEQAVLPPGIRALRALPGSTIHVHLYGREDLPAALAVSRIPMTRLVVHLRDSTRAPLRCGTAPRLTTRLLGSPAERLLLRRATLVVTPSQRLAEVADAAGAPRTLVVACAPTPPAAGLPGSPDRPLPDRPGRRIVSLGPLVARRRSTALVEILTELPDDVDLILVGTGPDRLAIDQAARRRGVSDRVAVVPIASHRTVAAHLGHADLVVNAALAGDDLPELLAAMSAGRPIVATTVEGAPSHVTAGIDGALVAPTDTAALARAAGRLLDNGGLAAALGAAARRRTRAHDWSRVAAQILDALPR